MISNCHCPANMSKTIGVVRIHEDIVFSAVSTLHGVGTIRQGGKLMERSPELLYVTIYYSKEGFLSSKG